MMIQRIQSLYLLAAAILMGYFSRAKLGNISENISINIPDNTVLMIVTILAAVLFFISIFLFKNPKKQKSAVYASMVITLASIITGAIILYSGEVCGTPTVACSCPVIAFIAAMLAVKGIKRDEKIIRDSERIR